MRIQASANWQGGFHGHGSIASESGALAGYPFSRFSRFELGEGSNPQELLAASHASSFILALSRMLDAAQLRAERLNVTADVDLDEVDGSLAITAVTLKVRATVPRVKPRLFQDCIAQAQVFCPLCKVLKTPIALDIDLMR